MSNPLLTPTDAPYGLPDLSVLTTADYREAIETGLAAQEAEVAAIAANDEAPTFENTVVALENSGRMLKRSMRIFFNKLASDSDEELRDLELELSPKLAAHQDAISFNDALYQRIKQVANADLSSLDDESRYLVSETLRGFELSGAALDADAKARLGEINQELSELSSRFEKNLLNDTNDLAVLFDSAEELDGLTEGLLSSCASAAADRGQAGKYLVALRNFSVHPFLSQLTNRTSRQRIYEATAVKGRRDNEWDNRPLVSRMTALRAERAGLMGHPNHVSLAVADQTVGDPDRITEVVYPLAAPAVANMYREAEALQAVIDAQCEQSGTERFELAPWDWAYYADQLREQRYAIDTAALRPFFECDRVLRDGVFHAATELYGITFEERPEWTTYHPDARIFEVFDADGHALGLFIHDVHARESKRGGAWMNALVEQNFLNDERPVIVNNLNVPKPAAGEPVLLSLDEVTTMFHEFGHALHGLFSHATYSSFSGTSVPRDFVEFPSQVNEMWITWPEVVQHYARHFETDEPIDQSVLDSLRKSALFNEGFATTEYLGAALLDQEWHRLAPGTVIAPDGVEAFEAEALERIGLANPYVAPRYRTAYFQHTFGSGYDGKYYAYIWSEVLDADTVEWFRDNGGLTRANGDHFRAELLSRGRTRDPLESYRAFRGRDAVIEPLLARRGLLAD